MKILSVRMLATTGMILGLNGCGSPGIIPSTELFSNDTTKQISQSVNGENSVPDIKNKDPFAQLTPFSTYADEWKGSTANGGEFSGTYTRVQIFSDVFSDATIDSNGNLIKSQGAVSWPYEGRYWLNRALMGKDFSINLTAKIKVGVFESTVPLATIGHQSNSEGEHWSRTIHHDSTNFPLFLVKNDGSTPAPQIQISVKAANNYASRGAAAAVGVAIQVAKAIASPPSVITRLTAETTKSNAQVLDNAISKLFGDGLSEEHWTDRDLRMWSTREDGSGPAGVTVQFEIPSDEKNYKSTPLPVGRWRITFDYPRPSIFSDWRICPRPINDKKEMPRCKYNVTAANGTVTATGADLARAAVISEVKTGEVLNYKLLASSGELSTIRAYFLQLNWYATALSAFATANNNTAKEAAPDFCKSVTNEIIGLGLNAFDASIVLRAVYEGLPGKFPKFEEDPKCAKLMPKISERS